MADLLDFPESAPSAGATASSRRGKVKSHARQGPAQMLMFEFEDAQILDTRIVAPAEDVALQESAARQSDVATAPQRPALTSDADARAGALDIRSSCIVEAPAGSGKTGLIVQRFLKLLAGDTADASQTGVDPSGVHPAGVDHSGVDQPEEVLAMTFTRKATAEMQERVLLELQSAQDGTPLRDGSSPFELQTRALAEAVLARSAQLGWNLLAQPQRLNIRSILSVCLEIAQSLPVLSGSGVQGDPVEDASALYRMAARRTLLQLGGPDDQLHAALRTILLRRDGSLANCESLIAGMLATRDQWGELVPLGPGALHDAVLDQQVRPRLERALESIVCSGLSRALDALPARALQELTTLAARLGGEPGYRGGISPIGICANKHEPPEAIAAHLEQWVALVHLLLKQDRGWRSGFNSNHLGFAIPAPDKAVLGQLVEDIQTDRLQEVLSAVLDLPPARYPDEQWAVAKALFHVLSRALVELKLLFSSRGECDYVELALAARQALLSGESAADLALTAGGRLRHLLVDEMQDTSAAQYDLIKLLTSSWDGHSQTLFLVGDPKQSIYLFREARVERFLRTMREGRLGDITLVPLRLTANFRSQAALVMGFNQVFGGSDTSGAIFPGPADHALRRNDAVDVPFVAATAVRPETLPQAIVWHTSVRGEEIYDATLRLTGVVAADHIAEEAIQIRRIIEERLHEDCLREERLREERLPHSPGGGEGQSRPCSIAVLGRARSHLAAIVQELKAHDGKPAIPYRAVDLDALDELPEVLDALALTRALLHPADRIAWLAVLRAPWCGLGLADLLALTGEGAHSDADAPALATASVAELVRLRRQHLSPVGQRLLDRAWPVLATAASSRGCNPLSVQVERTWRSLGGDAPLTLLQRDNVERYLGVLRELEQDSSLSGRDLLPVLQVRLKSLYAEPDPAPAGQAQVELMTIHKAKGLEWDVVIIPGLDREPRAHHGVLLNWLELDGSTGAAGGSEGSADGALQESEEASIILAPIWERGQDTDKLNHWIRQVRTQRERAEEKRLFYVAATRAREQLHLFAAVDRRGPTLAPPVSGSLLQACWPAAQPHFDALAVPFTARSSPALDSSPEAGAPPSSSGAGPGTDGTAHPALIQRLPLSFDPAARLSRAAAERLPYSPASALVYTPAFDRPEGSLGARAFGNVVHRYLQLLAARLAGGSAADALLSELPSWEARLSVSLRGEGLPPATAAREAARALRALQLTLGDPAGRWILEPHPMAASEHALTRASHTSFRVDRTFAAGAAPLSRGDDCIWIVDFKTTEQGSRSDENFFASEQAKYSGQLAAYAEIRRSLPRGDRPIQVGLFYPLVPRLLHWLAVPPAKPAHLQ